LLFSCGLATIPNQLNQTSFITAKTLSANDCLHEGAYRFFMPGHFNPFKREPFKKLLTANETGTEKHLGTALA
jgi:hypothetical protein